MGNTDLESTVKGIFGLVAAMVAVAVLFWIAVIAFSILAGLMVALSLLAAKSGRAIVDEEKFGSALYWSIVASAGLAGSIFFGSFGVDILKQMANGEIVWASEYEITAAGSEILDDSWWFFVRLVPVCFLANRVFVARKAGGAVWLGVVPPLIAMVIFSLAVHSEDLAVVLQQPREVFIAIIDRTISNLRQPFELAALGWRDGNALISLINRTIQADWPNLFKLVDFFPTAFFGFAVAAAGRALIPN